MNNYFTISCFLSILSLVSVLGFYSMISQGSDRHAGMAIAALLYGGSYIIGIFLINSLIATFLAWKNNINNDWVVPSLWIHSIVAVVVLLLSLFIFYSKFIDKNYFKMKVQFQERNNADLAIRYIKYPFFLSKEQIIEFAEQNYVGMKNEELLRLLARKGQDIGGAALCTAVITDELDAVNIMLEKNINPNHPCRKTIVAGEVGSQEVMDVLVAAGLDLNFRHFQNSYTTFMQLLDDSREYDLDREDRLFDLLHKVRIPYKVNSDGGKSVTALMLAAEKDYKRIVGYLLEKGADVYSQDEYGKTALMYANTYDMVKLLLKNDLLRDVKNRDGETAQDIYKKLNLYGALAAIKNLPVPDSERFLMAIRHKNVEKVNELKNVNLNKTEKYNVLINALQFSSVEILDLIKPIFDSTAHKYPQTDYFGIASDSYTHRNSRKLRAIWVLRHGYIYKETHSVVRYLEESNRDMHHRNLSLENSGFLLNLKAHLFPLDRASVRKYFVENIDFSNLARMPIDADDWGYLHGLIKDYAINNIQSWADANIFVRLSNIDKLDLKKIATSINLINYWKKLHKNEEKIGYYSDESYESYLVNNYNKFSLEDHLKLNEYIKLMIDNPFQFKLSKELADILMVSDPVFASGKYDLTPFVVIGDRDVTEEEQLQSAFDRAFADIEALDNFLNLAKIFAGKDRRVKRHVSLIVSLYAGLLVEIVGKNNLPVSEKLFLHFMDNIYPATTDVQDEAMSYNLSVIASQGLIISVALNNAQISKLVFDKLLGEKFDITTHKNRALIYNLACYYSTTNNKTAMLEAIRQARKRGAPPKQFMDDVDFNNYRSDKDFLEAIN